MIFSKYFRESLAISQRILIELFRRKRSLILWSFFPISLLIINSLIIADQNQISIAQAFENIAPSTLVGVALFFSCLGGTVSTIVSEREQSTLKRLFLSPLSGFSYFIGIFIAHSFIGLGQTLIVYTIAVCWGAKFQGSLLLPGLIIFLSIVSYVGLGFILSTQLARRTEDVNSIVAAFGIPLLILGGSFFPSAFFPKSLLQIAKFNPIYHMNEALVGLIANGYSFYQIRTHFIFLCIFSLLVLITAWICYQFMIRSERRL